MNKVQSITLRKFSYADFRYAPIQGGVWLCAVGGLTPGFPSRMPHKEIAGYENNTGTRCVYGKNDISFCISALFGKSGEERQKDGKDKTK
jgi:hypothetical protein